MRTGNFAIDQTLGVEEGRRVCVMQCDPCAASDLRLLLVPACSLRVHTDVLRAARTSVVSVDVRAIACCVFCIALVTFCEHWSDLKKKKAWAHAWAFLLSG